MKSGFKGSIVISLPSGHNPIPVDYGVKVRTVPDGSQEQEIMIEPVGLPPLHRPRFDLR